MARVQVVASEPAKEYVRSHGGTAYVRARRDRCCTGVLTTLRVTTAPEPGVTDYVPVEAGDIEVMFQGGVSGEPQELVIDIRGLLRQRLAAYWDGCAYKL
jgi:hypothetical protein